MPDELDFLAQMKARPDDVALRAVYADWLDEQGDHNRAWYVRAVAATAQAVGDEAISYSLLFDDERHRLSDEEREWVDVVQILRPPSPEVQIEGTPRRLRSLNQFPVHGVGYDRPSPKEGDYRRRVEAVLAAERERTGREPVLIPPRGGLDDPGPWDRPEIVCVGYFDHLGQRFRDWTLYPPDAHVPMVFVDSDLVVVWLQRQFAFPIDPDVLLALNDVPWSHHAREEEHPWPG